MNSYRKETSILQLEDRKCESFLIGTGKNGKIIGNWDTCSTASRGGRSLSPLSFLRLTYSHTSPWQAAGSLCFPWTEKMAARQLLSFLTLPPQTKINQSPSGPTCARDTLIGPRWVRCPSQSHTDRNKTLLTTFSSFQPHEPRAAHLWLWVTEAIRATLSTKKELQGRGLGISWLQDRKSSCTPDLFWVTYPQLGWPMQSHNMRASIKWKYSISCSTTMKNLRCWQQNCPRVETSKPRACEASPCMEGGSLRREDMDRQGFPKFSVLSNCWYFALIIGLL